MRLTYKGDYALKAVLDLALHYEEALVTIQEMAERLDIPPKFLEQVLLDLKRGGFVESKRGKVGGYMLAKDPSGIVLGDVIRFIDGPIEPIGCLEKDYTGCNSMHTCAFKDIWMQVTAATAEIINNVTFRDLVETYKRKCKTEKNMYYI
jgi:Rrf2 family protein